MGDVQAMIRQDAGHPTKYALLEMEGTVPEIEAGQRITWRSSGEQRFIHRIHPNLETDDDGYVISSTGAKVETYKGIPDFEMGPRRIEFHRPDDSALCLLERVLHMEQEQIIQSAGAVFEVFALSSLGEPLTIAWSTFDEEHPLELTFANPMERTLPSFQLSIHLSVPADFAKRWRKP